MSNVSKFGLRTESGPWLHLLINDWSVVFPKSQVHSLQEAGLSASLSSDEKLFFLGSNGWPVFDIDVDLNPQPVQQRRFLVFLKGFSTPIGIFVDRVDILMPEDIQKRVAVPSLLGDVQYITSMMVLRDGVVSAEIDATLLTLHLQKTLPENVVLAMDALQEDTDA